MSIDRGLTSRPFALNLPPGRSTGSDVPRRKVLVCVSPVTFMLSQTYGSAARNGIQKT